MSESHLKKLRTELVANHWDVLSESGVLVNGRNFEWNLARRNGDCPLTLAFTPGTDGQYGGGEPFDDINLAYACEVSDFPDVAHLYFGSKFNGKFQMDVVEFVAQLSAIEDRITSPAESTDKSTNGG